ncbi:metalloprotease PmbA [Gammaproteobacteria bacterium]|nr:metalloprotease PmbA [Gammaproteobacteria bacterium]
MKKVSAIEFSTKDLEIMTSEILTEAKKQSATSSEVDISINRGFTVTVRNGDVETVEYHRDKSVSITSYVNNKTGSVSINDIRPEAINSAVKASCNIAKFTDEDICSGIAEKELLAFDYPKPEIFFPWSLTVDDAIEIGKQCEAIAISHSNLLSSEGVSISTSEVLHAYGNSNDFLGVVPLTQHEISCTLLAKKNNEMQRDFSYTISRDPDMLESIDVIAKQVSSKTLARLGAKQIKTCKSPVIFLAEEAKGLLGHFISAVSGGNLYRKSSFLLDHLGKKVFPSHINIFEKPFLPKALGSFPFDDDGVLARENSFIKDGCLANYILGTYSARKLGLKTTANAGGVHNLFINTGNSNLSALIKIMNKGLLITELMGQGVNMITGDYSRGCSGFWVENGEIQYPVEEITVAGNLIDMYMNLVEVGNDIDNRGSIHTGSVLLDNMTIAGI